jgi:hypothetical protein
VLITAAACFGAVSIPQRASALGPVDLEIAAELGGGTGTVSGAPNPLGLGLGGRAGVDIFGFYGGLAAMYYFGTGQDNYTLNSVGAVGHVHTSSSLIGLEGGWNINLSILTIRPLLGLGYYNRGLDFSSSANGHTSADSHSVYLQPGVTGLLTFGMWIVGADVSLLWVPAIDNSQVAVVAHGQFGIKL